MSYGLNGPMGTPSSDRSKLSNPFTVNSSQFDLHCETNLAKNEFMSVWVYSFEDCLNACVSYTLKAQTYSNTLCQGVAMFLDVRYGDSAPTYEGNCFLKALAVSQFNSSAKQSKSYINSAFLVTG